ncbi:MAG: FAD-dependent oxidoreductase [Candidatus Aminicenantes bacterium]|nr:FAD-dependent oxidoreductase [Candidatus Aminicenantes bacterium]
MSRKKQKFNVVIVGSGFSGIVAANILLDAGLDVLLIDENMHTGGQLLRKIPEKLGEYPGYRPDPVKKTGFGFVDSLRKKKIEILNRAIVIGIYPDNKILVEVDEKEVISVAYDVILFATGAREKFIPFKGWTLPGVYSTGLVQVLMKSSGVLPAERMVIGGSGLFLFAAAYEFLKNGGKVDAVLEQTPMFEKMKLLSQFFHQFSKFTEGAKYLLRIVLSGTAVRHRRKIVEARGEKALEEVVTARVNRAGRVIPGSEKIYKTGALAVGYGFTPNVELPQLAGCELEYAPGKGGWVVEVNRELETGIENIFAAGEITGVGGALKSITEGRMAAFAILKRLGKISGEEYSAKSKSLLRQRRRHLKFGEYFNLLYSIPGEMFLDIPGETVVCRCEDVTMDDIRKAVKHGYASPGSLKVAVRTGMGNCQGRICGPNVFEIISALTGEPQRQVGRFSVRPPIKPVSIGSLAEYRDNGKSG